MLLNIANSQINVECVSKRGNFNESIDIEKQGGDLKIGIDSKLLLDALKCIEFEKTVFDFHYDLDSEAEKKEKRLLVFDLLDEFVEDGGSIFDLFGQLTEELQTRGFLGNLSNKENKENNSTVAEK